MPVIEIKVNGTSYRLEVRPSETLLEMLRERLQLTGTKEGCGQGECGSCTVILGGKAVNSCLIPAPEAHQQEITTIEGLAEGDQLHPLQEAFITHGGIQCGFCTPGMILSAKALLDRNPNPSAEEIREAIAGNFCRCTGYLKIIESIQAAAEALSKRKPERGPSFSRRTFPKGGPSGEEFAVIGKRVPPVDGRGKATGTAVYLADLQIPRMLYGKVLRSPFPHARIVKIDTTRAEKLPGVRAVVTGREARGMRVGVIPHLANKPPLAEERVRFIGDEVAAVAAEREELAEEALGLIDVVYEELPALFDPLEAMKPGAIPIHEGGNIATHISRSYGDVEQAFLESDFIFQDRFETQAQAHCALEPHGCIAHLDPSGKLTVWVTTHNPHPLRKLLADLLGFPLPQIRVIKVCSGGSFGGKLGIEVNEIIAYLLSAKTRRPVRILNTPEEQFAAGRSRYPVIIELKTGVKKDGTLLAREVKVVTDNGAYHSHGVTVTMGIGTKCTYLWAPPHVKVEADVVFTNKAYGGAFRGYGNPQITFAIESQMDRIAEKLGLDLKDLYLKNANYPGQVTCMGHKVTSCGQWSCIQEAVAASGWEEKRRKPGKRGVGMASLMHTGGGIKGFFGESNLSDVFIKMNNDGTIDLASGAADLGQGSDTVLAQIAAEELGLRPEDVNVITGDTSVTPQCLGTWGSRDVFIAGNAARMAAGEVKGKLLEEASRILAAPVEELAARGRRVYVRKNPEQGIAIAQLATNYYQRGEILAGRKCYHDSTQYATDRQTGYGGAPTYGFGTHAIEVEVDRKTGQVKVLQVVAAHDLGRVINPMMAEGQIEGGVVQGLGYGLSEGLVWEKGRVLNPSLQDYRAFYSQDVPPIKALLVESNDPDGPYGAKGVAETGMIPTAAALANAIYDAVGVRIQSLPIMPEKILKALQEKEEAQKADRSLDDQGSD